MSIVYLVTSKCCLHCVCVTKKFWVNWNQNHWVCYVNFDIYHISKYNIKMWLLSQLCVCVNCYFDSSFVCISTAIGVSVVCVCVSQLRFWSQSCVSIAIVISIVYVWVNCEYARSCVCVCACQLRWWSQLCVCVCVNCHCGVSCACQLGLWS